MPKLFYDTADATRLRASLESLDTYVDDRDRNRWIPCGAFVANGVAYASFTASTSWDGLSLPDAASTRATATLFPPGTWSNGSISITAIFANGTASTGDVLIQLTACTITEGAAGSETTLYSAVTTAPAQNRIKVVSGTASRAVSANNDLILIKVFRAGSDASDTLANPILFLGALITYNPS